MEASVVSTKRRAFIMHQHSHRLFHHIAAALVLTGCTIERIDLGGIDTIGEVTVPSTTTTHTPTTTGLHTDDPSTCLAYKDDGDSRLIGCNETAQALAAGYCVEGPLDSTNPSTVCPNSTSPTGSSSTTTTSWTTTGATATTDPPTVTIPEGSTTTHETCTYVVENGTTVATSCGTAAPTGSTDAPCTYAIENGTSTFVGCGATTSTSPGPTCAVQNEAGEVTTVPCDETNPVPTCAVMDENGNVTQVDCGETNPGPTCEVMDENGNVTQVDCGSTTPTGPLASDEPLPLPPLEEDDSTAGLLTDEPVLMDAGAASVEVDTASP